jgi:hypothetical protein
MDKQDMHKEIWKENLVKWFKKGYTNRQMNGEANIP